MPKTLRLSPDLELPAAQAATESFAVLGMRGAGKSTTGVVMAEEMHAAGVPWVAIDPKGDWWGVRSGSGGGPGGLAIPVLGGLHGDVPLEASAGAEVANFIVDENVTAVLDVADFSLNDRHRFLVDFAERLYRRHRQDPQPRHVFLEEAHEYIPQQVSRDRARVKEAVARIPLMGRAFGLGSTTMSQRSARLHKDVLTQIGTLIAMRTTGPQDRRAILDWVEQHAVARELVDSLPELANGEAWVWSPTFLHTLRRVQIRQRQTFDSGATPITGKSRPPATLASVDLAGLRERMSATIEKAKADDPRELRKRITELERQLAKLPVVIKPVEVEKVVEKEVRVEVPMLSSEDVALLSGLRNSLQTADEKLDSILFVARRSHRDAEHKPTTKTVKKDDRAVVVSPAPIVAAQPTRSEPSGNGQLPKAERSFLAALAQFREGRTKGQAAFLAGYSPSVSTTKNALGRLRTMGYITGKGTDDDPLKITDAGLDALGDDWEPAPTGKALADYWFGKLPKAEQSFLRVAVEAYPSSLTKAEAAEAAGYDPSVSTTKNSLGRLRTLGLIVGGNDAIQASHDLVGGM